MFSTRTACRRLPHRIDESVLKCTRSIRSPTVRRCSASATSNKAQYNFSPASEQDDLVYGACRPGEEPESHSLPEEPTTESEVRAWAKFMKEQGVRRVVSLLDTAEVQKAYTFDIAAVMQEEFSAYNNIPISQPGTSGSIKKAFDDAAAAKEKVVVHCWQGQGRTGLALAQWLVQHHNLSPEEAAQQVVETAEKNGASRKVNVEKLQKQVASQ